MKGIHLLRYIIDTSDVVVAKKQEATEYLAGLMNAAAKLEATQAQLAEALRLLVPMANAADHFDECAPSVVLQLAARYVGPIPAFTVEELRAAAAFLNGEKKEG